MLYQIIATILLAFSAKLLSEVPGDSRIVGDAKGLYEFGLEPFAILFLVTVTVMGTGGPTGPVRRYKNEI